MHTQQVDEASTQKGKKSKGKEEFMVNRRTLWESSGRSVELAVSTMICYCCPEAMRLFSGAHSTVFVFFQYTIMQ